MKALTLALALVTGAAMLPGCYAETGGYVVDETPPAPREEVVTIRPGFVWVHGRWHHDGGQWAWRGGYYERERPGRHYVDGRWEQRGHRHIWIEGGWRT